MPVDFQQDAHVLDVAKRIEAFIRETVIPLEVERVGSMHGAAEDVRRSLQQAAREAGVFAPHVETELGGLGLDRRAQSLVFEKAGYSLFGPVALNIAAPDEGNVHLLSVVATAEQKEQYLVPLAKADIRSCFAMTEPAPGAGSDPSSLRTVATQVPGGWKINGHKWFTTGAIGADFAICMARTSGQPGDRGGCTMFLVDTSNSGMKLQRAIGTLDQSWFGGHAEVIFEDCFVPDSAVLGERDKGFEYAQVRLAPARLTHCMRWLGIAQRSQDIAIERCATRSVFGSLLGDLGMAQQLLADNEIDLVSSRAMILQTAWELDQGQSASQSTSITKTFVSEAIWRVVDRSLQLCGSLGISDDVLLSQYLREVRPFRIYDGPSETHRWAIARRLIRQQQRAQN